MNRLNRVLVVTYSISYGSITKYYLQNDLPELFNKYGHVEKIKISQNSTYFSIY